MEGYPNSAKLDTTAVAKENTQLVKKEYAFKTQSSINQTVC